MDVHPEKRIQGRDKRIAPSFVSLILLLISYQVSGAPIAPAPCTAENYIAPATQYEINQLKLNLDEDVRRAFQSGDEKLFYALLCRAAAARLVEAEFRLGIMHMMDWGVVKKNLYYARYWLERAASKGHLQSTYLLGSLYLNGEGGPVKGTRGVELLTIAAKAGEPQAMIELVQVYAEGKYVLQSIDTARYWAQQAKQAGHPDGQKMLDLLDKAPPTMRR